MIQITAQGKFIDTKEIRHLFTQGEKFSDYIHFILARINNDVDISDCKFVLRCVTVKGSMIESLIPSKVDGDNIILKWYPSHLMTSVPGMLRLELIAFKESDRIVKFQMPPIYIKEAVRGKDLPVPDVIEEKLALMNEILAQAIAIGQETDIAIGRINAARDSGVQAVYDAMNDVIASLAEVVTLSEQTEATE